MSHRHVRLPPANRDELEMARVCGSKRLPHSNVLSNFPLPPSTLTTPLIRKRVFGRMQPNGCGQSILGITPHFNGFPNDSECWRTRTVVLEDDDVARLEGRCEELFD